MLKPFALILSLLCGLAVQSADPKLAKTNAVPGDAFAVRRGEWLPLLTTARPLAATFPRETPVTAVEAMAFGGGRLWLIVRPRLDTNTPPGTGRVWAFTPELNRLEPVRGPLSEMVANALHFADGRLWLALNGGVAALDLGSAAIDAYDSRRGLLATNVAGITELDGHVTALDPRGVLYGRPPGSAGFIRATGSMPAPAGDRAAGWRWVAGSDRWLLVAGEASVLTRRADSPQWIPLGDEFNRGAPRLEPVRLQCVAGDGGGGFWLGSDAGLHWLDAETGLVENRFAPWHVTVPGGLGLVAPPGFQLTAQAYRQARDRVMNGVRDRMRDRARFARAVREGRPVSPAVTPTSRVPGGVTALLRDQTFLWIGATDGANPHRSRVLLYHQPTRQWVGWFPLALPVRSFAANDRHLWIGLDNAAAPAAAPLVAVDKLPLIAVSTNRWVRDPLDAGEIEQKLAAWPARERAVAAFFEGRPARVVELLAPDGLPSPEADAESLFLLAFAHDPAGLDQPAKLGGYLDLLTQRHPDSLFAELARQVRPVRAASLPEAVPPSDPAAVTAGAIPDEADIAAVLARRDLNGDGKLNAVELRLWRGPDAKVADFDTDGDGLLDAGELGKLLALPAE